MEPKKILIVKLASMGDILQNTTILPALKEAYPKAELHWICLKQFFPLLETNPYIAKLIEAPALTPRHLLKIYKAIWSEHYDTALIFHRSPLIHFFFKALGIPKRIGFGAVNFDLKKTRNARFFDILESFDSTFKEKEPAHRQLIFKIKDQDFKALDTHLSKAKYTITIAPLGGKNAHSEMKSRRWPYYKSLIESLSNRPDTQLVLIGGPDDQDHCDELQAINPKTITNLAGKITINKLAYLLKKSTRFIGNDSFPLFLALSQNTPSTAILGPTDPQKIFPEIPPTLQIITATTDEAPCAPCYNPIEGLRSIAYNCPHAIKCMTSISAEKIITKINQSTY